MGKYKLVDRATEPGPVGLCGTAPLWTTCRTIYGGQTVWKVVITAVPMKVEIAGPMSAMRTKLPSAHGQDQSDHS